MVSRVLAILFSLVCFLSYSQKNNKYNVENYYIFFDDSTTTFRMYNSENELFYTMGGYLLDESNKRIFFYVSDSIVIKSTEKYAYYNKTLDTSKVYVFIEFHHYNMPNVVVKDTFNILINDISYHYIYNKGVELEKNNHRNLRIHLFNEVINLDIKHTDNCVALDVICDFSTSEISSKDFPKQIMIDGQFYDIIFTEF